MKSSVVELVYEMNRLKMEQQEVRIKRDACKSVSQGTDAYEEYRSYVRLYDSLTRRIQWVRDKLFLQDVDRVRR